MRALPTSPALTEGIPGRLVRRLVLARQTRGPSPLASCGPTWIPRPLADPVPEFPICLVTCEIQNHVVTSIGCAIVRRRATDIAADPNIWLLRSAEPPRAPRCPVCLERHPRPAGNVVRWANCRRTSYLIDRTSFGRRPWRADEGPALIVQLNALFGPCWPWD